MKRCCHADNSGHDKDGYPNEGIDFDEGGGLPSNMGGTASSLHNLGIS